MLSMDEYEARSKRIAGSNLGPETTKSISTIPNAFARLKGMAKRDFFGDKRVSQEV